jgi:D-inositol-3-phosphate glycosyltransferase
VTAPVPTPVPLAPRRARHALPRRVAMLSVHTSPLHQPGTGDAGGMNVYIVELAKRLAALDIGVEIFTRATCSDDPPMVRMDSGVLVRHVTAGPFEGLSKEDLPAQLCAFTSGVLRTEAMHQPGYYDLLHSHYWLSGQVGWLAKERWGVPLVHSMHTLAKVKNAALAGGDAPEPAARLIGEAQVIEAADRLIANTEQEAAELVRLYGAGADQVAVAHPGVDLHSFTPGDRDAARARLGVPRDAVLLAFAGRIQPLKAPDVLLRAAAEMLAREPGLRDRLFVAVIGGPSGNGLAEPAHLRRLAGRLGISELTRFVPAVPQARLADWYRAANAVVVPSYNESFGLVAIEAQACGTPVVAAAVGGLRTAVADGRSGLLVAGHEPADYATALLRLVGDGARDVAARFGAAAVAHASAFGWSSTAARIAGIYADVITERRSSDRLVVST